VVIGGGAEDKGGNRGGLRKGLGYWTLQMAPLQVLLLPGSWSPPTTAFRSLPLRFLMVVVLISSFRELFFIDDVSWSLGKAGCPAAVRTELHSSYQRPDRSRARLGPHEGRSQWRSDCLLYSGSDPHLRASGKDCQGWTKESNTFTGDASNNQSNVWIESAVGCSTLGRYLCVQVDRQVAVGSTTVNGGPFLFLSKGKFVATSGLAAADAICDSETPQLNSGSARALLATTSRSALSLLRADTVYYRPDGVTLGTTTDLRDGNGQTGVWVHGDRTTETVDLPLVWEGSNFITDTGSSLGTCMDWSAETSGSETLIAGTDTIELWTTYVAGVHCADAHQIYCYTP